MGVWSKLATTQLVKFDRMNTRDAMRLVAYWKGRRKTSANDWRPVLAEIIRLAPERQRITNRLIATDLLLKIIFGETKTRPPVVSAVNAAVVNYIERSARILDRDKPNAIPPTIPVRVLDVAAERLVGFLKTKAPSKGLGGVALLVILLLATKKRR